MSKALHLIKTNASNPKVWIVAGVTVAGIIVLAETSRRMRRKAIIIKREDFGAFLERFELIPFPQPPPPAAKLPLSGLTFAIKDIFDVKGYVTGFGNPDWRRTHEPADKTAVVVTALLKNGAKCVGKTVMDELAFGVTGENKHYGTPTNPNMESNVPGGSSSGSAVAVAAELVDFALGTDTIGCVRIPASFCGILGFRPSHGAALSSVMVSLQRYEFKTNHEEWVKDVKPRLGAEISNHVLASINTTYGNVKNLYKVRTEMRAALQSLLKDDGILVIPTIADAPLKLNSKKGYSTEFHDNAYALLSIASMSGGCQVSVPLGKHDDCPVSVSFVTYHGADKFLLDTVLDMYASLQDQVSIASNSVPLPDVNGNMDASELLKEKGSWHLWWFKGNAAFKGMQWNKAVSYYSEAIKLNGTTATYYNNRAAAYLELGCFQQAEEDCSKAISLDKKNVKAYLRRGTARESLLCYKEALEDFKHALVLEPQNKVANLAEKRLRKLIS
ncbi:Tetratricopeptide repeat 1 - like 5 [Theobroma cacao]|nr:Tetratricopeptide repeat 1 - like 5 [Theobroma cacao]